MQSFGVLMEGIFLVDYNTLCHDHIANRSCDNNFVNFALFYSSAFVRFLHSSVFVSFCLHMLIQYMPVVIFCITCLHCCESSLGLHYSTEAEFSDVIGLKGLQEF